jgi:hypothetical protein
MSNTFLLYEPKIPALWALEQVRGLIRPTMESYRLWFKMIDLFSELSSIQSVFRWGSQTGLRRQQECNRK